MKNHYICLLIGAFLALSSSIAIGQDRNASKPQYIGVMYYLDTSGSLLALDRESPRPKTGLKAFGFGGARAAVLIDGERASLRVPVNQTASFVVGLPIGLDPRKFGLYSLAVKSGKRQLVIPTGNVFRTQLERLDIQLNISRYGENSYRLAPGSELPPGEYVFMSEDSAEAFCFGIDAKK